MLRLGRVPSDRRRWRREAPPARRRGPSWLAKTRASAARQIEWSIGIGQRQRWITLSLREDHARTRRQLRDEIGRRCVADAERNRARTDEELRAAETAGGGFRGDVGRDIDG